MTEGAGGSRENKLYLQNFYSLFFILHQLASSKHQSKPGLINTEISNKKSFKFIVASDRFIRITTTVIIFAFFFHYQNTLSKRCLAYRDGERKLHHWKMIKTTRSLNFFFSSEFSSDRLCLIAGSTWSAQEPQSPSDVKSVRSELRDVKVCRRLRFLAPVRNPPRLRRHGNHLKKHQV